MAVNPNIESDCTPIPLYIFRNVIPNVSSVGSWKPLLASDTKVSTWNLRASDLAPPGKRLNIVTWNVWFDATLQELRYQHLIGCLGDAVRPSSFEFKSFPNLLNRLLVTLFSSNSAIAQGPDVICLQEVTSAFETVLHASPIARSRWLVTRLQDETAVTGMHYGTIILVRRTLVVERGCTASVSFSPYPGTRCGRGISLLELKPPNRSPVSLMVGRSL